MSTADDTDPSPIGVSRRRVLVGVGAVCATCAAGCATYGSPSTAPSGPPPASGSGPTPGAGATPSAGLAAVSEIPVGGGTVFADRGVVVTQPRAGTFAAFGTTCPHQGCQVNDVTDGAISCPCHGSRFALTDGSPTDGPATSPLERRQVSVNGDRIVLS